MSVSLQAAVSAIQLAQQVQAKNVLRIHLGISIFDTATSNAVFYVVSTTAPCDLPLSRSACAFETSASG
jgi:hypothetical protein